MRWEHCTVEGPLVIWSGGPAGRVTMIGEANVTEMGRDGWEMVAIWETGAGRARATFKRPDPAQQRAKRGVR